MNFPPRPTRRAAVAAALLALVASTAPAAAVSAGPVRAQGPDRGLFLTVSGADQSWIRGVRLRCMPEPEGVHPEAAGACAALDAADGDFDRLAGRSKACTKRSEPIEVGATGSWHGRTVGWRKTYPNACLLDAATGPVFRF
ncbi:subtilase-type protease inhibitor [Streptomyces sp. LP05-1]|uniref:Subtilase-type protease inhibitor n=1 Tax=Streptomyces pyxinae TaxID=2970734 RepID=A0ABT2CE54_9ACTN|nr:subtilase-type protease inhibitor [Streptomyces sp. LP05-1]MCS0635695.1 subtilase-type protease inhibitor [Streptomyces sp. LP05-1]